MDSTFDIALRVLAAIVAGGLVGLDRDLHGKPAGVRLHALVALGAALLTAGGMDISSSDAANASRIIQGIVGGVGFLGAGVIMRAERGTRVFHLTTAATIWLTAALGVICGLGLWKLAAIGATGALIVLILGRSIDRSLFGRLGPDDLGPPPQA